MTDTPPRKTPVPGVPIRPAPGAPSAPRPTSRLEPRDTFDVVRDLGRDVEALGKQFTTDMDRLVDRLDVRLASHADQVTRIDERAERAQATADEAKRATLPRPIPWTRVIPISLSILALAATVLLAMDRKPSRDDLKELATEARARVGALEQQAATLERELAVSRTKAETLQAVLETVNKAVAGRDGAAPRRGK